jgi:hypothetical protein
MDLGVMRIEQSPITLFYDNSEVIAQSKKVRNHERGKHILSARIISLDCDSWKCGCGKAKLFH